MAARARDERWIDVYPSTGKQGDAYSWGSYNSHPYLFLNWGGTLDDVFTALSRNNMNVGGGYVVEAGELHLVQGISLTRNVDEIGAIVIASHDGVPVRIGDVGEVVEGHEIRRGAATAYGKGEVVLGLGFMLSIPSGYLNSWRITSPSTSIDSV